MALPENLDQIINSLKQELIASKTGNQGLKVKSLMKKFNLHRRTEDNTTKVTELLKKNDIVVNPSIMKSGGNWEVSLDDLIYLSIADGQKADTGVILAAVKESDELKKASKENILKAVKEDGRALQYAGEELQADKEVVLEAVKKNGSALRYASEELQADKEVVLEAVKEFGGALQYANEELKADKKFVLAAVKEDGYALEYAGEELKADKEVVLEAVKTNMSALEYASEELKADKEVVLEAVKTNMSALEYASEELKADKKFVLAAVKESGSALEYASEELKADKEFVLEAVKNNEDALCYASEELKADKEFVLEAIEIMSMSFEEAYEEGFLDCLDVKLVKSLRGKPKSIILYRNEIQRNKVQYKCVVNISSENFKKLKNNEISAESLADEYDEEFELDFNEPMDDDIDYYWEEQ